MQKSSSFDQGFIIFNGFLELAEGLFFLLDQGIYSAQICFNISYGFAGRYWGKNLHENHLVMGIISFITLEL